MKYKKEGAPVLLHPKLKPTCFQKHLSLFSETPWSFLKTSKSLHYDTLTSVKIFELDVKQMIDST